MAEEAQVAREGSSDDNNAAAKLSTAQLQRLKERNEQLMQRRLEAAAQKQRQEEERLVRTEMLQEQVRYSTTLKCFVFVKPAIHVLQDRPRVVLLYEKGVTHKTDPYVLQQVEPNTSKLLKVTHAYLPRLLVSANAHVLERVQAPVQGSLMTAEVLTHKCTQAIAPKFC